MKQAGIEIHHIAQEHSFVPYMWQRITNPDVLIFLDVTFEQSARRKRLNWNFDEYAEQQRRLGHAREHADYYLLTDPYTEAQVLQLVLGFLRENYPLLMPTQ